MTTNDVALVRYDQARAALAKAHSIDELKDIKNKAHALAGYARQAKDKDLIAWATEIRVRAERRCGEMTSQITTAQGRRTTSSQDATKSKEEQLADVGLTKQQASKYEQLAAIPEAKFDRVVDEVKDAVGEVTTAAVIAHAKPKKKKKAQPMADANTPVVMTPDKPKSEKYAVYEVWTAINTLATTEIDPSRLRSLMDDYQWHHIDSDSVQR